MATILLVEDTPANRALASKLLRGEKVAWFEDGDVATRVARAFIAGLDRLVEQSGSTRPGGWRWGRLHTLTFQHPLGERFGADSFDTGPSPTSGG